MTAYAWGAGRTEDGSRNFVGSEAARFQSGEIMRNSRNHVKALLVRNLSRRNILELLGLAGTAAAPASFGIEAPVPQAQPPGKKARPLRRVISARHPLFMAEEGLEMWRLLPEDFRTHCAAEAYAGGPRCSMLRVISESMRRNRVMGRNERPRCRSHWREEETLHLRIQRNTGASSQSGMQFRDRCKSEWTTTALRS